MHRRHFPAGAAASLLAFAGLAAQAQAQTQAPPVPPSPAPAPTQAEAAPTLVDCVAIGQAADRLACYDRLAGRAPPAPPPTVALPTQATATTSLLAPVGSAVPVAQASGGGSGGAGVGAAGKGGLGGGSVLSKFWELDAEDKRGTFNFTGYRPNYILPLHVTSRINRAPQSPTQAVVSQPNYRSVEAKFQLSLRTKAVQGLLLPGADLWLGFTQQALWQIWNGKDSKPFRNSDYEPEAIYMVPTPQAWQDLPAGWKWRYTQLALAHQSNGQSDPLSRSWNRVYLGAGIENGDYSLTARLNKRLNEPRLTDNNPDLIDYRGRGEFHFNWVPGAATASLLYRTSLQDVKYGALQFEWTYPVLRDQPNGLRWYVQVFRGYGETLTDYNFRQTSVGAGVTFLQF